MSYNAETEKYEGYIYIIENDVVPDMKYIGQTTRTVKIRWKDHLDAAHEGRKAKLYSYMNKYGCEHFHPRKLRKYVADDKTSLKKILDEKEIMYIRKYDTFYNGLNLTMGGYTRDNYFKPVKEYDLWGNFLKEWDSYDKLKTYLKRDNPVGVNLCCNGKIKYAFGKIWRFKDDDLYKYPLPTENEIRRGLRRESTKGRVKQYDCFGNLLNSYKDAYEASEKTGTPAQNIFMCCEGRIIYCGHYTWRFDNDTYYRPNMFWKRHKPLCLLDLNNNLQKIYWSFEQTKRDIGLCVDTISKYCNNLQPYLNYKFCFVEDVVRGKIKINADKEAEYYWASES